MATEQTIGTRTARLYGQGWTSTTDTTGTKIIITISIPAENFSSYNYAAGVPATSATLLMPFWPPGVSTANYYIFSTATARMPGNMLIFTYTCALDATTATATTGGEIYTISSSWPSERVDLCNCTKWRAAFASTATTPTAIAAAEEKERKTLKLIDNIIKATEDFDIKKAEAALDASPQTLGLTADQKDNAKCLLNRKLRGITDVLIAHHALRLTKQTPSIPNDDQNINKISTPPTGSVHGYKYLLSELSSVTSGDGYAVTWEYIGYKDIDTWIYDTVG